VQRPPRSPEELARLEEQLYAAVCETPGETMIVLAARLGMPSRRLEVPIKRLKRAGRVRSVGQRNGARYFPMAEERATRTKLVAVGKES
jgi:predicted transcriptional regulator